EIDTEYLRQHTIVSIATTRIVPRAGRIATRISLATAGCTSNNTRTTYLRACLRQFEGWVHVLMPSRVLLSRRMNLAQRRAVRACRLVVLTSGYRGLTANPVRKRSPRRKRCSDG